MDENGPDVSSAAPIGMSRLPLCALRMLTAVSSSAASSILEVRTIALYGVRLIDPRALRMRPEQNDL